MKSLIKFYARYIPLTLVGFFLQGLANPWLLQQGYPKLPIWAAFVFGFLATLAIDKLFGILKAIFILAVITPVVYSGLEIISHKLHIPWDWKTMWAIRGMAITLASFIYAYGIKLISYGFNQIFKLISWPLVFVKDKMFFMLKKIWFKFKKIPPCPINKSLTEIDSFGKGDTYEKGRVFEEYIAQMYRVIGFDAKTTTQLRKEGKLPPSIQARGGSGEQGVDVIYTVPTEVGLKKVIIQCKHYSQKVSNQAIQEIVGAMKLYGGDHAVVITNNYFTKPAIELALANGVTLIDRDRLKEVIAKATKIYYKNYEEYRQRPEEKLTLPDDLAA